MDTNSEISQGYNEFLKTLRYHCKLFGRGKYTISEHLFKILLGDKGSYRIINDTEDNVDYEIRVNQGTERGHIVKSNRRLFSKKRGRIGITPEGLRYLKHTNSLESQTEAIL